MTGKDIPAIRVLAVDDNPDDRWFLQRLLKPRPGYELLVAGSASEALTNLDEHAVDCVVLDYRMPESTGIELADQILSREGGDEIALVMLTGQGSEEVAVQAMKRGVHDYLVKGAITAENLEFAIHSSIERVTTRSELKRQRAALEASNRELERFSSMVAHDLQSPLSSVEMMLRVLQARASGDPQLHAYADQALSASRRMRDLIVELLDYSRAGGSTSSPFQPVDVAELGDEVAEQLAADLEATGTALRWSATGTVLADRVQLRQLFANLVGNGAKYGRDGVPTEVQVTTRNGRESVRILIADNGRGMTAEFLENAFEPFSRERAEPAGTGLGLAICRKIAEYHGGTLTLTSELGSGTTAMLTFPNPTPSLEATSGGKRT